ncbi:MAG: diacylglycerol kinase [Acidobacteria bacterium]|nr:diacylglycerol kinase [Acidobacteriota bacterium]
MTDSSPARRAAVVYNPVKVDLDALRSVVAAEEQRAGWLETVWVATSEEDPGGGAAKEALESGAQLVIAAGGDGTVRAVAEVVAGSDASLGLLPAGTGNLLARNLELTLDDLEHSIHTAFTGRDRAIDAGTIEVRRDGGRTTSHLFLVMAGVGIDAKMLAGTDEGLKARIGWLAYVGALVKALRDSNRIAMRFAVDGRRARQVHAHTVIVGNCGTLTANVLLLPDAVVDDGIFDIVFFRPSGVLGWAQVLRKVLWENGVLRRVRGGDRFMTGEIDSLNYVRGRELTVKLSSPQEIELDGDPIGVTTGFRARVDRGGLRVRVPID